MPWVELIVKPGLGIEPVWLPSWLYRAVNERITFRNLGS